MSDCPRPGCNWRNIYRTTTDGSRELEAAEHEQTHRGEAALRARIGELIEEWETDHLHGLRYAARILRDALDSTS